jgi:hypothetical protein
MREHLKRSLPFISAASLLVGVVCLFVVARERRHFLTDTGETTRAAEAAVAEIQSLHPDSLDVPQLRPALQRLAKTRPVAWVWLIGADGQIRFSTAPYANRGQVEEWAFDETRRVISEMPAGFLSPQQRVALLAGSAIQREGEHNDVLRHIIRPLPDKQDTNLGFIGVAYDINSQGGGFPGFGYAIPLLLVPIGLLVYWVTLPWWVFLDARARGERAWIWMLFVLLGNLVALLAYLLARHPQGMEGRLAKPATSVWGWLLRKVR